MYYVRGVGYKRVWTEEEDAEVQEHYATLPRKGLMALLPDRDGSQSWNTAASSNSAGRIWQKIRSLAQRGFLIQTWSLCAAMDGTITPDAPLGEAVFTIIQEGLATTLGLEPVGTVKTRKLPLGGCKSYQYLLWVHFLDQGYLVKLGLIEAPRLLHPDNRVKCLIGRDILQFVKLLYNGPDNTFSLSF